MKYGIWFSCVNGCAEGWLQQEIGNGRCRTMTFDGLEEAEDQCRIETMNGPDTAFFVSKYPEPDQREWRAEWYAARDRVKTLPRRFR